MAFKADPIRSDYDVGKFVDTRLVTQADVVDTFLEKTQYIEKSIKAGIIPKPGGGYYATVNDILEQAKAQWVHGTSWATAGERVLQLCGVTNPPSFMGSRSAQLAAMGGVDSHQILLNQRQFFRFFLALIETKYPTTTEAVQARRQDTVGLLVTTHSDYRASLSTAATAGLEEADSREVWVQQKTPRKRTRMTRHAPKWESPQKTTELALIAEEIPAAMEDDSSTDGSEASVDDQPLEKAPGDAWASDDGSSRQPTKRQRLGLETDVLEGVGFPAANWALSSPSTAIIQDLVPEEEGPARESLLDVLNRRERRLIVQGGSAKIVLDYLKRLGRRRPAPRPPLAVRITQAGPDDVMQPEEEPQDLAEQAPEDVPDLVEQAPAPAQILVSSETLTVDITHEISALHITTAPPVELPQEQVYLPLVMTTRESSGVHLESRAAAWAETYSAYKFEISQEWRNHPSAHAAELREYVRNARAARASVESTRKQHLDLVEVDTQALRLIEELDTSIAEAELLLHPVVIVQTPAAPEPAVSPAVPMLLAAGAVALVSPAALVAGAAVGLTAAMAFETTAAPPCVAVDPEPTTPLALPTVEMIPRVPTAAPVKVLRAPILLDYISLWIRDCLRNRKTMYESGYSTELSEVVEMPEYSMAMTMIFALSARRGKAAWPTIRTQAHNVLSAAMAMSATAAPCPPEIINVVDACTQYPPSFSALCAQWGGGLPQTFANIAVGNSGTLSRVSVPPPASCGLAALAHRLLSMA